MKKPILLIFSSLMLVSLVACGGESQTSSADLTSSDSSSAATVSSQNAVPSDSSVTEESEPMVGAFGEERALTTEEEEIFSEATAELVGVEYTPLAVSTQVVAGTNYRFRCSGETANESGDVKEYYVTVYVSLDSGDSPTITDISEI